MLINCEKDHKKEKELWKEDFIGGGGETLKTKFILYKFLKN